MTMKWRVILLSAVFVLAAALPAASTIIPSLDLAGLVQSADAIVVAEVSSVRDAGLGSIRVAGKPVPGREEVATLRVFRTLRGVARKRIELRTFVPEPYLGYGEVLERQRGVFLLKRTERGIYVAASPYYPSVPAAPETAPSSGSLYARVVHEVAGVLRSSSALPAERRQAVSVLTPLRPGEATKALRMAAKSDSDEKTRLLALGALLKRNDITLLRRASDILLNTPADTIARSYPLAALASSLILVKDPAALPTLSQLMGSPSTWVRKGAVQALARIGTRDAIDPLIKALYDSDQDVRFYAVSGLAGITGQDKWGPGSDYYKPREDYYLSHWKDWAKER